MPGFLRSACCGAWGWRKSRSKRGVKPQDVARETKRRLAELRIAGASVAEIQRDTGLTKTVATRLAGEVDAALAAIKAGRVLGRLIPTFCSRPKAHVATGVAVLRGL